MTISSTDNREEYVGNGVTTVFAVPFRFLQNSFIRALLVAADGTEAMQTETTDYTLVGADLDAGGTLTMLVAPPIGSRLVIFRETALTQETDYGSGDAFPAESHERALDKLTMQAQEGATNTGRTLRLGPGAADDVSTQLPNPVPSSFLAWDALGKNIINAAGALNLPVSAFIATLLDDIDAAAARSTLEAAGSGLIGTSGLTMNTARMLGRVTAGTGAIEELDAAGVSAFAAPASTSAQGVVPLATTAEMITGTNATKAATVDAIRKGYVVRGTYTSLPAATAVDVSSLPSWMTHFEFQFNLLSTNGSSALLARLGDSGGIRISGYSGAASTISTSSVFSVASDASGLSLIASGSGPTLTLGGIITCDLIDAVSNIWIMRSHVFYLGAGTTWVSGCTKTLPSSAMNAFRLTTVGGVDTFDAGSFNYAYW